MSENVIAIDPYFACIIGIILGGLFGAFIVSLMVAAGQEKNARDKND